MKESVRLGKNLRQIREEQNVTQGEIAEALGVGRDFISKIENGKTNPTLATISKIAKALHVPIEKLIK